ncbi:MAG: 16S rRNA (cytosine(1402)-N(4))-methyltransferase RsmH [Alphaproteobacteria bacterium]|nr:16S rRNA (cytosine(1402)-N(4))-methyltransferase RsmH [Alphaproteobacteria bacterium]
MSAHVPVMLDEVLEELLPRAGGLYVDATFGGGSYTKAILAAADCKVVAIDRDPEAIARGRALAGQFGGRLVVVASRFSRADQVAPPSDGVVFDLGVSSFQLEAAGRGFSFRENGPLDMRMDMQGPSAADLVNTADESELAETLSRFGEERHAGRIARAIVRSRPLNSTAELAEIVAKALGPAAAHGRLHPATRTFQALRIRVNDEMAELVAGLEAAQRILKPKGRLVVVSFHSLEDRIVKQFLAARSGRKASRSRHAPDASANAGPAEFKVLTMRPRTPRPSEIANNPRARSARLRAAERLAA